MTSTPRLTFVSPRFLFPTDSGGKIRTTQILRGLKGGAFQVTLLMPATGEQRARYGAEIETVCDRFIPWESSRPKGLAATCARALSLFSRYPVSVAADRDSVAARTVRDALDEQPDVAVFDFPHAAVLAPPMIGVPSVMFTHNVETEIVKRHADVTTAFAMRAIWRNQHSKMQRYERQALARFDTVIAVSERDCSFFRREWQIEHCRAIPTGVDTDFFTYEPPGDQPVVVFCGSMDWIPNIDAVTFFHDHVWPSIRAEVPRSRMKVIGHTPPANLVRHIGSVSPDWEFTGFVDDVRKHVCGAAAFVIPLRIGGGTRIKAFEAMAMGAPVVSTSIGVEGLPLVDGTHYVNADEPAALAHGVISLLRDTDRRQRISHAARQLVEREYGFRRAAQIFEQICLETVTRKGAAATAA